MKISGELYHTKTLKFPSHSTIEARSASGHERRIDGASAKSGPPPIAAELAGGARSHVPLAAVGC
jgi:hypothetical protein